MKIVKATLRRLCIDLKKGFQTSFATMTQKDFSVLELEDENGLKGYGELSPLPYPWYSEETQNGALDIVKRILIPALLDGEVESPEAFFDATKWIRRNRMARACVDCALWDLYSKNQGLPEYKALGGVKNKVEAGVSLGVEKTPDDLLRTIEKYMGEGYRRVKCKIKPGKDIEYVRAIRREFPHIMLMLDANSAYTLDDMDLFRELDQYDLLMIEQPLGSDDIVDHRHLQAAIKTPICLDESIDTLDDARRAIELGSCRIINIKVARVGGLTEAKRIQQYAGEHGVFCWCGGMLDQGVARGHNLAAASLPYYRYPNDIPGSDRYYPVDIVTPSRFIDRDAMVELPETPGFGFELNMPVIEKHMTDLWTLGRK